jgi:hypothetical protein
MTGRVRLTARPVWRSRWAARAPKAITVVVVSILCVAGLRAVIAGPPEAPRPPRVLFGSDLAQQSFAEAFARAYLTWDAARPTEHERQVAGFITDALGPGAGLSVPRRGAQHVVWTAAVQDRQLGRSGRLVTVAAQTTRAASCSSGATPHLSDRRP